MQSKTADVLTLPTLALATSAYALFIDHHQQTVEKTDDRWEPDGLFFEFLFPTCLSLLAGTIRSRLEGTTTHDTERAFVLAAIVGHAPIAIWQIARSYQRQHERADTWRDAYRERSLSIISRNSKKRRK